MSEFRLPPTPIITGNPQVGTTKPAPQTARTGKQDFRTLLGQAVEQNRQDSKLTLSKHAMQRAEQRGIEFTTSDLERMDQAVDKARDKGVTDTLIFMNNTAFIVNVPSKTVVTLMGSNEAQENVFTNINGAVIL